MNKWLRTVPVDVALVSSVIYLIYNDVPWLYNVTYFVLWFIAILVGIVVLFGRDHIEKALNEKASTYSFDIYQGVSDGVLVLALASAGNFVLASILAIGAIVMNDVRTKARK